LLYLLVIVYAASDAHNSATIALAVMFSIAVVIIILLVVYIVINGEYETRCGCEPLTHALFSSAVFSDFYELLLLQHC